MFGKKKTEEVRMGSSFDRLVNYSFKDENLDKQLIELADVLMANRPLLASFEQIKSLSEANRAESFLAGVTYALGGDVYSLGDETRLFASGLAFQDGSLQRYIKDFAIK